MAGKQFGAAVRQFQRLFNVGTAIGLTDDQLLARFVSHRDDAAFETLIERHGPMVLSVCRGMLKDPNDAQDAFQATFLVLIRKAGSIRAGVSLGSWLYRVAFNMAIQINSDAARRERLERRAAEMANPIEKDETRGADLVPALYEEVNRLPEKYRLPVVLCHLEEMTHAQAAQQLGWTEGAVRGRVAKAREVLRRRLARRGLALSAGTVATAIAGRSASAMAAVVPAAWVDGTVKAAMAIAAGQAVTAGAVSAAAVTFSDTMMRSLFMTKLKLAAAALLAAGGAALVCAEFVVAGPEDGVLRNDSVPAGFRAVTPAIAKASGPKADEKTKRVPVAGRVVDPDGRPVAGAKLYVTPFYEIKPIPPTAVRASTGPDGSFSFDLTPAEREAAARMPKNERNEEMFPLFVAMAAGFGPAFGFPTNQAGDQTIRLVRDDIPVQGRILNVEGRPVAGARVQVVEIFWAIEEDLSRWREALRAEKAAFPAQGRLLKWWITPSVADLYPAAVAGADGRFTLRGIGRERIAAIIIEGPSIRTTFENVVTSREPMLRVPPFPDPNAPFNFMYYGPRFDHVADPSRPVVGIVHDKDTGKPIAGAVVRSSMPVGMSMRFVETKTDVDGHYRLDGLRILTERKPDGDEIMVTAPEGEPYLPAVQPIAEPAAAKAVTRDLTLKRGIWITGRVIDKATGQGHRASVDYYLFKDNPHATEAAHFGYDRHASGHHRTADDGTFRLAGLPGHGLLCIRAGNEPFRMGVGAERIKAKAMVSDAEAIDVLPSLILVNNFHVLAEINPTDEMKEATFDLALDRGQMIKGRVLDPQGRPLSGARSCGLGGWWGSWGEPLPSADFEVTALASGDIRTVAFLHPERHLAGSATLRADAQEPIEVKLEPWGIVTGRLVDKEGEPRPGVRLEWTVNANRPKREGQGNLPDVIKTDAGGRFRIEGLAPGLKYSLHILGNGGLFGPVFNNLTITAGETKELGDVKNLDE